MQPSPLFGPPARPLCEYQRSLDASTSTLANKFAEAREFAPWIEEYRGRREKLDAGAIEFDEQTLRRAADHQ